MRRGSRRGQWQGEAEGDRGARCAGKVAAFAERGIERRGRAQADDAWLTIMSNPNIVAVASLTDVSCIILCEGVVPDAGVASLAAEKGVNLLGSGQSAFALAAEISRRL